MYHQGITIRLCLPNLSKTDFTISTRYIFYHDFCSDMFLYIRRNGPRLSIDTGARTKSNYDLDWFAGEIGTNGIFPHREKKQTCTHQYHYDTTEPVSYNH